MASHHAGKRRTILGRIAANIGFIAVVASCSAPEEASERAVEEKQESIVWHDQLTTSEDALNPELVNDQRREVFEEQDAEVHGDPVLPGYAWLRSIAQESTAILVNAAHLVERQPSDPSLLKYPDTLALKARKNLCSGQRYESQPAPGFCSGTLIDNDLILTAAHCVAGVDARAVFGHYNIATDALGDIECDTPAGEVCESNDVFRLRQILIGDRLTSLGEDWAILQLVDANFDSKPATPRYRPAPVRLDGTPLELGTPLAKIGAPNGLPIKLSLSKQVGTMIGIAQATEKRYFAFIDTFQGDSGGGVYDATAFELAAVVSQGPNFTFMGEPTDFVPRLPLPSDLSQSCNIAGVCPMSAERRAELVAAGVTVRCQDEDGQLAAEALVRVDVPLSHLCGFGTGVAPIVTPPPDFTGSERLCGRIQNETCDSAEPFDLKLNHEVTLSGDTTEFADDVSASCANTGDSPDAFYRFEVPDGEQVLFYADAFGPGNTFDTVLFLRGDCSPTGELACNDDSVDCPGEGNSPAFRSRLLEQLGPGTYFLGIEGFDGASGKYAIHVQALALSDNGILLDESDLNDPVFIEGNTNDSAASRFESRCGVPGARDFQVAYATCPDSRGGLVFTTTCSALTTFDTVLAFEQGSRPFTGCNDDMLDFVCFRQSQLGFTSAIRANSGAGIRALYVDGFSPADSGQFELNFFLPP